MQEITKIMLMDLDRNFEIDYACCVDEGLKKLAIGAYDVVVSDYEMPQKNGLQFLKELRGQRNGIPFVLFTGKGREEVAIKALNLGADGYVNKQGNPETVYGELFHVLINTVERKTAIEKLRNSEAQLKAIFLNAPIGIAWSNSGTLFQSANQTFCRILGYSEEELQKLTFKDIIYPDDISESISKMKELRSGRIPLFSHEKRYVRKDGTVINGRVTVSTVRNQEGKITLFIAELEDITERKKTEEALRESELHYRLLAENAQDVIWTANLNGNVTYISPSVLQLRGYTAEEAMQQSLFESLTPSSAQIVLEGIQRFAETGEIAQTSFELEQPCKDCSTVWVESTFTILWNSKGEPESILGVSRNISERKKAERVLIEIEANYRNLINGMPESAWVIDSEGNFLEVNDAAAKMLGYSKEELLSIGIKGIDSYLSSDQVKGLVSRTFLGETQIFETEHTAKDGRKIPVEISSSLITYSGKPMILAIARDIAERRKADDALRKTVSDLEESQRIAGLGTYLWNISTGFFESSPVLDDLFGIDETYNHNTEGWLLLIHPDDRVVIVDYMQNEVVGRRMPFDKEYRIVRAVDKVVRWMHGLGKLEFDARGQPVTMRGTILDITERKLDEKKLKESYNQIELVNEKLQVIGSLTRHDVGNKLSSVSSYVYFLRKHIGDNFELSKYLNGIELAVNNSKKLFEFSRFYEKIGLEKLTEIDVSKCFTQAVFLKPSLKTLKVVDDCHGLKVVADSLLEQLFYTLIDNSLKHGEKVTQIRLYYTEDVDGVKLFYEDNGVGVPDANKSKLFEIGFTTGNGAGLGLYLVKKMMKVYGWKIEENGLPGIGAKFTMAIPRFDKNGKKI